MSTHIPIDRARELVGKVLHKHGYTAKESEVIGEILLFGGLRESSQGLNKLFGWHANRAEQAKEPTITQVTDAIARCDAKRNSGMYANFLATEHLLAHIGKTGLSLIGVTNFNSSSGPLCYYTKKIVEAGHVGLMFASADPIGGIAPQGRKIGVFGTNPLSISVPYREGDITLDMSTARYTWGDLVKADISGESLAPGLAFDVRGNPTTSPKEAMNGSVNSFDGSYKSMGLAMMIQIIAGALVGSVYAQSDELCDYGSLIIGIDPARLGGRAFMDEQVGKIVEAYKGGEGADVRLPGERGDARYRANLGAGRVPIESELYEKIVGESG